MPLLKKILVANRGEVAIRVMRACRELNIKTVAVFSDADQDALFAHYADEKYRLGPADAAESYLNIDKVILAAKETGCDGIHPGYGFLSENPKFVAACESAGIRFIGPSSESIRLLGNKFNSKLTVKKYGLDILPMNENPIATAEEAVQSAAKIGYPVIFKAAAGGGGRGMSMIENESQLAEAFKLARSAAQSSFADSEIFIEKFVRQPRHIEFQFIADALGNVVCFYERECSIQMKHRKLVEESPSPVVTDEKRQQIMMVIRHLVKELGYQNTGTVEFLYDEGKFYFIEINTRLQVEHTITELLTNMDIVKEQILIASGFPLSFGQEDVQPKGWAIECRINAESPQNKFFPSIGRLKAYRAPGGIGVRIDSGIYSNSTITVDYDSLVSKVSALGRNRNEAISRMSRALYEYIIAGIDTTIPLHIAIMNDPEFQSGNYHTGFIKGKIERLCLQMQALYEQNSLLQDKVPEIHPVVHPTAKQPNNTVKIDAAMPIPEPVKIDLSRIPGSLG